jgi:hypothetical protein
MGGVKLVGYASLEKDRDQVGESALGGHSLLRMTNHFPTLLPELGAPFRDPAH